jgi:signal transduction histidine kinase
MIMDYNTAKTAAKNNSARHRSAQLLAVLVSILCLAGAQKSLAADAAGTSPADAPGLPLITIRQFLDGAPSWGEGEPVRVRGTVTHSISDKTFFIQEADAGTYVFHKPPTAFHVGELVEVTGFPSLGSIAPTLQHCEARAIGSGTLPEPKAATAAEARSGKYNMRVIRVRGLLAPERLRGGRILVLNPGDGEKAFTADLEAFSNLTPFDHFESDSLLELTGVCAIRRDAVGAPASFNVFIRSPGDIVVIKPPPWWNPARTWRVLGFATLGLALALAWVLTLRRQIRQQTAHIRQMNEDLERRVQERTAELTEANEELDAFSYSVSHDLRAPLRHMSGFAAILMQHPSVAQTPDLQRPVDTISNAATQMARMVDDLLEFSRMARQPLSLQVIAFDPLVKGALQDLEPDTTGRLIEWKLAPLPEVRGDLATLRLVWLNLLGNAIKYTRQRSPATVEIGCHSGEREWIFFVRDNGAGFDMRYAENLFGVFQRLHKDDEFEGTGIGLAHVRRIIHRHGGRVWAEGELGRGATFYFALPR